MTCMTAWVINSPKDHVPRNGFLAVGVKKATLNGFFVYCPLAAEVAGGVGVQMYWCVVSRSQKHGASRLFSFG